MCTDAIYYLQYRGPNTSYIIDQLILGCQLQPAEGSGKSSEKFHSRESWAGLGLAGLGEGIDNKVYLRWAGLVGCLGCLGPSLKTNQYEGGPAVQCSEAQCRTPGPGTILPCHTVPHSQFGTKAGNHLLSTSEGSLWVVFVDHSYPSGIWELIV